MENEQSSFNVIHWECDLEQVEKPPRFDVQMDVTGGWVEEIPVLQFRWRVMWYVENSVVLHIVAENNYVIPDLESFNESKMKVLLLKSNDKVNHELGERTKEMGILINVSANDFPDSEISGHYKYFLQALNTR